MENRDQDSLEETSLMQENIESQYGDRFRPDGINDLSESDDVDKDTDDFDMAEYMKEMHIENLDDIKSNAKEHHLKVRNMPIKVHL